MPRYSVLLSIIMSKSVGVSRQWSGTIGKVDNCQGGVFAVLGHGTHATPIDCRLYLPKKWIEDPDRCEKAGVPAHRITLLRKQDLALELVQAARQKGISFIGLAAMVSMVRILLFCASWMKWARFL